MTLKSLGITVLNNDPSLALVAKGHDEPTLSFRPFIRNNEDVPAPRYGCNLFSHYGTFLPSPFI